MTNPNALILELFDDPSSAPHYNSDVIAVDIRKCVVIGNGTTNGMPTVDFQIVDKEGKQYVAMLTGRLIASLYTAVRSKDPTGTL